MKNKLQLIRQIIKEETSKFIKKKKLLEEKSILINKLNRLNEQWNPDDNYVGNYFVATAPMDEPGETKVHVIGDDQYDEYSEAGWDVEGPYSKKEAEKKMNKIHSSNSQWRYFNENESNVAFIYKPSNGVDPRYKVVGDGYTIKINDQYGLNIYPSEVGKVAYLYYNNPKNINSYKAFDKTVKDFELVSWAKDHINGDLAFDKAESELDDESGFPIGPDDDNKIGYMGEGDSDGRAEDRYWKNTATSAERFSGDEEDGDSFDMRDSGSDEYSGKEFLERELKSEKIRFKDFPVYYDSSTPDVGGVEFGQLLIPNGHIFILFKNNDDIEIRKYNGDKVKNFNLEVDSVGDVITYIKQLQGNFISETKKLVKTKMLKEDNGSLRATLHTLVGNEMKLGKRADMHGGVDWQVEEHKKAEKELEMFLLQNPSMLEFVEEVEEHFLKRLYR